MSTSLQDLVESLVDAAITAGRDSDPGGPESLDAKVDRLKAQLLAEIEKLQQPRS